MKNSFLSFLFAFSLAGCMGHNKPVQAYSAEEAAEIYNRTIDVNVYENRTILVMPCRRAGVRFNNEGYSIHCAYELFFEHIREAEHLRVAGVSYWDDNLDGRVDKLYVNDIPVSVNSDTIDRFYQRKLREFKKKDVEELWHNFLNNRNNPPE